VRLTFVNDEVVPSKLVEYFLINVADFIRRNAYVPLAILVSLSWLDNVACELHSFFL
jgi:hypothetical protein